MTAQGPKLRRCGRCKEEKDPSNFFPAGFVCLECHDNAATTAPARKQESRRQGSIRWSVRNRAKASENQLVRKKALALGVTTPELRDVLAWWDTYKAKRETKINRADIPAT